ncbi:MAG TPA: LysR family transcriptional regulator [Elusimicrobiota bacterium]|nr:LysR family transcriptional regulator [Elusimicrobiota bacterium]HMX42465.1 LysR family transcriptional regulator [Elusimicrobiota bacterium]HMX95187.1 LysR family transcriptional regulator [Elusimicrobiota bacterium]HND64177.1 LysR family transcriptional regulator [Elusimicrobiota bacterium]
MHIETLKIFCDVARLRSFSRSAEVHNVTQSAASQAVHQLESRLGVTLIDRSRRPWTLTPAGKQFYDGCRGLIDQYGALERRVSGRPRTENAEVRVAAIYSVGLRHMREFVEKFSRQNPAVKVHLEYAHPDRVVDAVSEGRADVGIVSFPPTRRDLDVIPWRREEIVVACAPDHPFARRTEVDPARLTGEPFVAFDKDLTVRREMDRFLKKTGVAVEVALEFDNIEAIKQAVEIGAGVSLLPAPTVEREVRAGALAAIPLKGKPFYRPLGILQRRGNAPRPDVAGFVRALRADGAPNDEKPDRGAMSTRTGRIK